jgi:hypothetical protein
LAAEVNRAGAGSGHVANTDCAVIPRKGGFRATHLPPESRLPAIIYLKAAARIDDKTFWHDKFWVTALPTPVGGTSIRKIATKADSRLSEPMVL